MMTPLLLLLATAPAQAETLDGPDGSYTVVLAPGWRNDHGVLAYMGEGLKVSLHDARAVSPADYRVTLDEISEKDFAGVRAASWAGALSDGREAACIDTRGAEGLTPRFQTWCFVDLGEGKAAFLSMRTRNLIHGREYGQLLQDLLPYVHPAGAVPTELSELAHAAPGAAAVDPLAPIVSAPASSSEGGARVASAPVAGPSLAALGFQCASGRWNISAPSDDLQVWWKPASQELIAHFTVVDGTASIAFTLGGTVDVGPENKEAPGHRELFGHLELREGPTSTASGIHRFFQSVDVQGTLDGGRVSSFRTVEDEGFTLLGACPSS